MSIEKFGTNLVYSVKDGSILFRVDTSKEHGLSKSEKSVIVATTHGAVEIDGLMYNINVYKPAPNKPVKAKAKAKPKRKMLEM